MRKLAVLMLVSMFLFGALAQVSSAGKTDDWQQQVIDAFERSDNDVTELKSVTTTRQITRGQVIDAWESSDSGADVTPVDAVDDGKRYFKVTKRPTLKPVTTTRRFKTRKYRVSRRYPIKAVSRTRRLKGRNGLSTPANLEKKIQKPLERKIDDA